ncbi:MAG: peptidylprolyl isomerase FKBP-type [Caulobacteraceae bacterium]|nr:peptidylprolyl isomerase FKBP-type [Caulobacteraceae bacterium]
MIRRCALALIAILSLTACQPKAAVKPPAEESANAAFMAKNSKEPGVVTLPDGLQYKIVSSGPATGVPPKAQDEVKVNYEGKLLSGEVFDSSFARGQPAAFPLDEVISGWTEVMQLMRPGDEWMVWIPPTLGYGDEAKGPIPGNSVLQFRIQLLGVLPHQAG